MSELVRNRTVRTATRIVALALAGAVLAGCATQREPAPNAGFIEKPGLQMRNLGPGSGERRLNRCSRGSHRI